MKVLVACECSGVVRDAFAALGHDAWSCDILPSERGGKHLQSSVLSPDIVKGGWDLMIAHPDCTFLAVSGARWMAEEWREEAQLAALHFVKALWRFPIPRVAIENPVGRLTNLWRGATQYVQPWQFGHGETKNTGLWLRGLPPLTPTNIVEGRASHRRNHESHSMTNPQDILTSAIQAAIIRVLSDKLRERECWMRQVVTGSQERIMRDAAREDAAALERVIGILRRGEG